MKILGRAALMAALISAGCSDSSTTTPAATTPTSPTTETFASIVAPSGTASRTFTAAAAGTITVTLTTATPPSNVVMGLGLGVPNTSGVGCALTSSLNTAAGSVPQITATADAGSYCVAILDIGGAPPTGVNFSISIFHP